MRPGVDKVVFGVTAAITVAFLVWGFISTSSLTSVSGRALDWTKVNTGWLFVLTATGFVVFVIWLALGRFGDIPLGSDGEKPEFRTVSWIAMMFSAGMGIGLMFYGVNEPLTHFVDPAPGHRRRRQPRGRAARDGDHDVPLDAAPLGHLRRAGHRDRLQRLPQGSAAAGQRGLRPAARPRAVEGPAGRVIDILAIFATLFGSAASSGLGALQIGAGLEIVAGMGSVGNGVLVGIIVVLTVAFIFSAVSGVARASSGCPTPTWCSHWSSRCSSSWSARRCSSST